MSTQAAGDARAKAAHDFLERMALALRGQRQQHLRAGRAQLERGELLGESHVARTHAGGIDQYQLLAT